MNWHILRACFLLCIVHLSFSSFAGTLSQEELATQRDIFIRAEHALKKNDHANYERLAAKITTYPLYPYLIYYDLKHKIQTTKPASVSLEQIEKFSQKYPDFPYNQSLRNLWLEQMAKSKNWTQFVKGYPKNNTNEELACSYHYAQFQLTQNPAHLKEAKSLWLVGHSLPPLCDQLFKAWAKTGGLTEKLIWDRFKLALDEKNFTLAKHLVKQLPAKERSFAHEWEKLIKNPYLLLSENFLLRLETNDKITAKMLTQGMGLLARRQPEKALQWWKAQKDNFAFSTSQRGKIERDIAVYLAHQRSPFAREWLAQLSDDTLDTPALEWRIRLALVQNDWADALMWINRLPNELKDDKSWRYWRARAMEAMGNTAEALPIYKQLAASRSYYGFVSSLHLKQSLSMHHQAVPTEPAMIKHVNELPAIVRFHELTHLGKTAIARVEWFRAVDKMNEQEILAAAQIAHQMHLHDVVIFTIAKADFKDDIQIRFPLAHQKDIVSNAKRHNIDPAWVFGVARQESAFFTEAVSSAGARGLLQLLPTTAKPLAKKHAINYDSEYSLHEPKINVEIGTVYLKNLKDQMHSHTILATASYNAGPTRTLRWLPEEQQEADIWIESIPYKETREYVKNVLTFTSIYRQRLGYPSAFNLMMKPIPPKV